MKTRSEKSENRRALPKFLLLTAAAVIAGVGIGELAAAADATIFPDGVRAALGWFFTNCTAYVLAALGAVIVIAGARTVVYGKKQLAALGDEDEGFRAVDRTLSTGLNVINAAFIPAYFFSGALLCYLEPMPHWQSMLGLVSFVAILAAAIVFQQRIVDLTKKLYPEKRGSVYDFKFQDKWYGSCDEAERAVIAQAAMAAQKATTRACLVLWGVFVVTHIFFRTGLLPIFAVSAIWFVSFLTYAARAAKLEKDGVK